MLWRTMLVLSVVAIVGFGTVPSAFANCENSVIEYLQISPNGTVSQGTWLNVHGKGNCGTSKIQVNGIDKAEIGNNEVTTTIKTEEFSAGNLQICYLLRDDNDGSWGNATRVCQDVWVNAAPPRPVGTVPADIKTYCMNHGYDRGYCPGDGYSCICERLNSQAPLNMYDVCEWQTGGQNPYPGLENFSAPAWTCNSSPAYVAQPPASPPNNPAPSNPQPSNPAPSSGSSIPNTNARVGDDVQVVNSPSSSPLLCKSSAKRGQDNVTGRITNGSRMTIIAGPWQDGGLYFVQVTGACNGYVATGQSGEMWIEKVESGNIDSPSTTNTMNVGYYHEPWGTSYQFTLDPGSCTILNGAEIVANEISHFNQMLSQTSSVSEWAMVISYFFPNAGVTKGEVERFRQCFVNQLSGVSNCDSFVFQVGTRYMDTSGLGNIVFGYYAGIKRIDYEREDVIGNLEQGGNIRSFLQFYDNQDDLIQRLVGRRLAETYLRPPSSNEVSDMAQQLNLR